MAALEAHDLVAGYHRGRTRTPVLDVASLIAPAGQLVAVIGPNGGGKSTLLRTLIGAQPPLRGVVRLDGTSLADLDRRERARRIAVVLTDRVDPGLLTVGDVVELGRHPHTGWSGYLTAEDVEIAHAAAAHLGVLAMWDRPFAVLSDGQRQRVLVARALAQRPRVLVLDEPTAFLDLGGRIELTLTLAELAHTAHLVTGPVDGDDDAAMAVIVATHDLELALAHADRVWLVVGGTVVDRARPSWPTTARSWPPSPHRTRPNGWPPCSTPPCALVVDAVLSSAPARTAAVEDRLQHEPDEEEHGTGQQRPLRHRQGRDQQPGDGDHGRDDHRRPVVPVQHRLNLPSRRWP